MSEQTVEPEPDAIVAFREDVKGDLDQCIKHWRNVRDTSDSRSKRMLAAHYIDVFQSVRNSLFGEMLPSENVKDDDANQS